MARFLLVSTRPEDEAVEAEYLCFLNVTGLSADDLEQVRLDSLGLPEIDVCHYDGIFVAGSPYGTTTPDSRKSATQKRTEEELFHLFADIEKFNVPCLTTGFGTEVAAVRRGGVVSKKYGEWSDIVEIMVTADGFDDPLLADMPHDFLVYVNHREAVEVLPEGAVVLARSFGCPTQVMRLGEKFWATQFNPEIDSDAIRMRLAAYSDAGFAGTEDLDSLMRTGRRGKGEHTGGQLLRNFVALCSGD